VPFVTAAENRRSARGGVDGEDIDNAKIRGPIVLRTGDRAVTVEDYEQLALRAAPEVARVRCLPVTEALGAVRVLVVPSAQHEDGLLTYEQLVPSEELMKRIARFIDERRMLGARAVIGMPSYRGVTVTASLRARTNVSPARLKEAALAALYSHFNPIAGGSDGKGWPFGRSVQAGEVYTVLQRLRGVDYVEDALVFPADLITGERGDPSQRIELAPDELPFSYEHDVMVEGA
jgi:predicted phage baseplate assembly protein